MMEGSDQTINEQLNGTEEVPADPMEDFSRQLEDIINTYGSTSSLMQEHISMLEKTEEANADEAATPIEASEAGPEERKDDSKLIKGLGKEATSLLQSLNKLGSPEEKVEMVLKKYTELVEKHRTEKQQMEKRQGLLVNQRDQTQFEHSRAILARTKLEMLCRELHKHNKTVKEESVQRLQEDEMKRREITAHFQSTLADIQAQIEQHSTRNNKLCQENSDLAGKLKTLIDQYERREQSLEKIFKHRDLQQKLSDAKLEEANMLLKDAQEKHKREKEYLLKEAIDKTKKCYAMREQELQMKKQIVLYSQKFEEFQGTLAKSNEIYTTFKQEMEKMTKKMKKLEKESNIWKTRFESCNKALVEMIDERSEKAKEFEFFTVKIDRLETLCRALQDERKILYNKIKEIRIPGKAALSDPVDMPQMDELPEPAPNPVLTAEMEKLREQQIRLQELAASLAKPIIDDAEESDEEEEASTSDVPEKSQPEPSKQEDKPESVVVSEEKSETQPKPLQVENSEPQTEKQESTKEEPKQEVTKVEATKQETSKSEPTKPETESKVPQELQQPEITEPQPEKQESVKEEPKQEEMTKVEEIQQEKSEPAKPEGESKPPQDSPQPETTEPQPEKQESVKEEPKQEEVTKVEATKQETVALEPTELKPVQQKEGMPEEKNVEDAKSELHETQTPKQAKENVQKEQDASDGAKAQASKPKAPKSQDAKSKSSKSQPKKQGSSKKKGSAKGGNKS